MERTFVKFVHLGYEFKCVILSEFSVYSQAWIIFFWLHEELFILQFEPKIEAYYVIFGKLFGIIGGSPNISYSLIIPVIQGLYH